MKNRLLITMTSSVFSPAYSKTVVQKVVQTSSVKKPLDYNSQIIVSVMATGHAGSGILGNAFQTKDVPSRVYKDISLTQKIARVHFENMNIHSSVFKWEDLRTLLVIFFTLF